MAGLRLIAYNIILSEFILKFLISTIVSHPLESFRHLLQHYAYKLELKNQRQWKQFFFNYLFVISVQYQAGTLKKHSTSITHDL